MLKTRTHLSTTLFFCPLSCVINGVNSGHVDERFAKDLFRIAHYRHRNDKNTTSWLWLDALIGESCERMLDQRI
jgi:hypothetical protein